MASGTVATARLGTGTANTTTYLRGDSTWATAGGGVTSVATGNGLSGGTITSTGTLVVACPGFNTVGSYAYGYMTHTSAITSGGTYSAGSGGSQVQSYNNRSNTNNLSGTWRWMAAPSGANCCGNVVLGVICRVS